MQNNQGRNPPEAIGQLNSVSDGLALWRLVLVERNIGTPADKKCVIMDFRELGHLTDEQTELLIQGGGLSAA